MGKAARIVATVMVSFLAACGSGGNGGGGGATQNPGQPAPAPPAPGCVIQFQIQTCTPGVLISEATNPQPPAPPILPNFTVPAQWETPEYNANFGLDQIGASLAYATGATGEGVTIAIIDVGNQTNHPEVFGRVHPASTSIYDERGDIVEGDNRWAHGL